MARIKEEDLRLNLIIGGDDTRKKMSELRGELSQTKTSLAALEKERAKLSKSGKASAEELSRLDQKIEAHRTSVKNLQGNYKDYERRLSLTGMTIKELTAHSRNLSAVLRNLQPGTKEWKTYQTELQKTRARLTELRGGCSSTASAMKALSGAATKAMGIVAGVTAVARVFSGAVEKMRDFEQANANLATILGVSTKEISGLTDEALRLGQSTQYTASEVTGLQTELAKLGFSQQQIKAMSEPVLNFATAVGADLPEAAALAGATLRMFGLNATDTDDVLGALALSTNKSALSFDYLQTALSIVGPVANTFGFGIKDTTALLGALANSGFDASSAATATRNILLNLADANGKLAKAIGGPVKSFDELLLGLEELNARGIDLAGTLELTDKRSVAAFNTFLAGTEATAELRNGIEETSGALKEIAEKRMDTLEGATKRLSSAWEGFILELRGSTGVLKSVTEWLTKMINAFTNTISGGKVEHNNSVNDILEELRSTYATDEEALDAATQMLTEYERKADEIRELMAKPENKFKKGSFENALKWAEEYASRIRDVIDRLNVTDDTSGTPTVVTDGDGGNGGNGGNGGGNSIKSKKTWSLQSDEAYLKAKAELTRQYNEGSIADESSYQEQLYQAELAAYNARLALQKDKGAERSRIEIAMQDAVMKHNADVQKRNKAAEEQKKKAAEEAAKLEQQALQVFIKVLEDRKAIATAQEEEEKTRFQKEIAQYEAQKDAIENYQQVVETLKRQHNNNLRKIELDYMDAVRNDLEAERNKKIAETQAEYAYELNLQTTTSARKLEIQKEISKQSAEINALYIRQQVELLKQITDTGMAAGVALSPEQLIKYQTELAKLQKSLAEAEAVIENMVEKDVWTNLKNIFTGTGGGSLFGVSQSDWEQLFSNLDKSTMSAKDLSSIIGGIGGMASEGMKIASQAVELMNTKEKKAFDDWNKNNEKKKANLEKRLQAGQITEAQYNAEVERMEKERTVREDEMKLQQAQRQKKMSIIEATINAALGVSKTLAQWGIPAGIAPAAIMAAMGAAQVALIASQPIGYESGGLVDVERRQDGKAFRARVTPGRRGRIDDPSILVAEEGPEYVIPSDGLANPTLAPLIDQIETARRKGSLRTADFDGTTGGLQPGMAPIIRSIDTARRQGTLKSLSMAAAYSPHGYAAGGYTPRGGAVPSSERGTYADRAGAYGGSGATENLIPSLQKLADRFEELSRRPLTAEVKMLGRGGLEEAMQKRETQKRRSKIA